MYIIIIIIIVFTSTIENALLAKGTSDSRIQDIDSWISVNMLKLNRDQTELLIRFNTRFRFYPLSRAFSNRCVLDEQVQRISVDGRPKRIAMYA